MLSKQTLESNRRMSPSERLALAFRAIRENQRFLDIGSDAIVSRQFERLHQENDARNRHMLERLEAAEQFS